MLLTPSVERAKAYLDAQLARPAAGLTPSTGRAEGPYVTISRESGSGGSTLAQLLADALNADHGEEPSWTVFDQNLVDQVLQDQHLSPRLARFLPEDKVSEIDAAVREIVGLHPNLWMLVQQTRLLMREIARCGHAILVGRGANFATASVPSGLHVRLVAPRGHRATVMAQRLHISVSEGAAYNRKVDAARRDFVRSVFEADVADPASYDLTINTARLAPAAAVELLTLRVRALTPATAR